MKWVYRGAIALTFGMVSVAFAYSPFYQPVQQWTEAASMAYWNRYFYADSQPTCPECGHWLHPPFADMKCCNAKCDRWYFKSP